MGLFTQWPRLRVSTQRNRATDCADFTGQNVGLARADISSLLLARSWR